MDGGDGHDRIWGGAGADSLVGGAGDDSLDGGGGNDTLNRGEGNDTLSGGEGDDTLQGDAGNEKLYGGNGNDCLVGGDGSDYLSGGEGDDAFNDDAGGNTSVEGGASNDQIFVAGDGGYVNGGDGDDQLTTLGNGLTLHGNAGDDYIWSTGNDVSVSGDDGNDQLLAYGNNVTVSGGQGDDEITGVGSDMTLSGDTGSDYIITNSSGTRTADGGEGNDTLVAQGENNPGYYTSQTTLTGGIGNDVFVVSVYPGHQGSEITITDLIEGADPATLRDGDQTNNNFVNLGEAGNIGFPNSPYPLDTGGFYTANNLAAYNSANGTAYATPLTWMRADWIENGVLDWAWYEGGDPTVTLHVTLSDVTSADQLTWDNTNVVCFVRGTLIETSRGAVAIESLRAGDLVLTRDNGMQPLRWIGSRHLAGADLPDRRRPIRIRAGALGAGLPTADLLVSPQHRVLVRSKIAQRMFGAPEVLVAATLLCLIDRNHVDQVTEVDYFHMLFDRHEIVLSNGAETESLYTGPEALKSVGPAARDEIFAIFPELRDTVSAPSAVRPLVSGKLARKLAERHAQNRQALAS